LGSEPDEGVRGEIHHDTRGQRSGGGWRYPSTPNLNAFRTRSDRSTHLSSTGRVISLAHRNPSAWPGQSNKVGSRPRHIGSHGAGQPGSHEAARSPNPARRPGGPPAVILRLLPGDLGRCGGGISGAGGCHLLRRVRRSSRARRHRGDRAPWASDGSEDDMVAGPLLAPALGSG
jgi:hypothetical protein